MNDSYSAAIRAGGAVEYLRLIKLASEVSGSDIEVMLSDRLDSSFFDLRHIPETLGDAPEV